MKVLLTRPLAQSEQFAEMLTEAFGEDVEVLISPLMRIEFLSAQQPEGTPDAVVFTSRNGVEGLARLGWLGGQTAYCVGEKTQAAALAAGFRAVSSGGDVLSLASLLKKKAQGQTLLYARGTHIARELKGLLTEANITLHEVTVYAQRDEPMTEKARTSLDKDREFLLPVFSPRSAQRLGQELPSDRKAIDRVLCISTAAAEIADQEGFTKISIAKRPTADAMMDQIATLVRLAGA